MQFRHTLATLFVLSLASSSFALGLAQRTFVSAGTGNDTNPCTRQLPCRNFVTAISLTSVGGEVVALDSGGYGPTGINQSIELVAPTGVHAAITALPTSANAIAILGGASTVVILRGLSLNALGGSTGIYFPSGHTLYVENCVISGFPQQGLNALANPSVIHVSDTVARENGDAFSFSADTSMTITIDHVRAEESLSSGFLFSNNANATVSDSIAAGGSGAYGFFATGANSVMRLENCVSTHNATGVGTSTIAYVGRSAITANGVGLSHGAGADLFSYTDNHVAGNTVDGTFTTTVSPQ
jgi:hypothetical protein